VPVRDHQHPGPDGSFHAGGVSINALGEGSMTVSVMVARNSIDSPQPAIARSSSRPSSDPEQTGKAMTESQGTEAQRFRHALHQRVRGPTPWFALMYCSLFYAFRFYRRTEQWRLAETWPRINSAPGSTAICEMTLILAISSRPCNPVRADGTTPLAKVDATVAASCPACSLQSFL